MRRFARLVHDIVVEIVCTNHEISDIFHPDLTWVEVLAPNVELGWIYENDAFRPAPDRVREIPLMGGQDHELHALKSDLANLAARVSALAAAANPDVRREASEPQ